jgi:hypothetical protein
MGGVKFFSPKRNLGIWYEWNEMLTKGGIDNMRVGLEYYLTEE